MPNLTFDPQPEPLVSSPPFSIKPPPHNLSKSFLIGILIFVLLSVTAYGAYRYGQSVVMTRSIPPISTPTEKVSSFSNVPSPKATPAVVDGTVGWKTYKEETAGFEIKYPENWFLQGPTSEDQSVYFKSDESFGAGSEPIKYFVFATVTKRADSTSFADFATRGLSGKIKSGFKYTKETINGYSVYRTESLPARPSYSLSTFITRDEKSFVLLSLVPFDRQEPFEGQEKYVSIFDQILSTFKFL